ncbi:MAG: CoA-binding protein [Thermodesulfobacteriota bacterium]
MSLEALFNPESVAVVGASRSEGKAGHTIVANLIAGGCSATIVPINPATDQLLGLSCYPSLADYGKEVDLVVVALPGDQVKAVIEECRKVKIVIGHWPGHAE